MKACAFSDLRELNLELYGTLHSTPPQWGASQLQNIKSALNSKHRRQDCLIFTWAAHLLAQTHKWFQTSSPPAGVPQWCHERSPKIWVTLSRLKTNSLTGGLCLPPVPHCSASPSCNWTSISPTPVECHFPGLPLSPNHKSSASSPAFANRWQCDGSVAPTILLALQCPPGSPPCAPPFSSSSP